MKKLVVEIEEFTDSGGDWPPPNALRAVRWFQAKINDVPAEFRGAAQIKFESENRFDTVWATIEVSYLRPETDEEEANREHQASLSQAQIRREDMATLAALQAKYGSGGLS